MARNSDDPSLNAAAFLERAENAASACYDLTVRTDVRRDGRCAWPFVLPAFIVAACGGQTGGDSSSTANGGDGSNSRANGGATTRVGPDGDTDASSGSGGSSGTGGLMGDGGSTGGATDRCSLPIDTRQCDGGPLVVHDPATGLCKNLGSQACPNNENSFGSLASCLGCAGARPDFGVCDRSSDCMLTNAYCCPVCEPLDASAFASVNRMRVDEFAASVDCGLSCDPCIVYDASVDTRGYFIADCLNGICIVVDVRQVAPAAPSPAGLP
jgi:hypothetical protein